MPRGHTSCGVAGAGDGRAGWSSRVGVVLSVAGCAVGLGNFLRFPGLAAKYGGGIFLVPYFTALLLLGIPIAWAEWTIGRTGGRRGWNGAPGIFRAVSGWRHGHLLGVPGLVVPLLVYVYYVVIESWCVAYAWAYLSGRLPLGGAAAAYGRWFDDLAGIPASGSLTGGATPALLALLACLAANLAIVHRGISRGIERFSTFAMPLLVACALVVLARVLTLGTPDAAHPERNVLDGLGFMWNPRPRDGASWLGTLLDPDLWLQATGQVFFTLGVGFGILATYASYLRDDDDVVLSSMAANAANEFCEVCLGGLITIPAAFVFLGADPVRRVAGSTIGLGFHALPAVFETMPAGRVFGFLWFLMLALAALTSSVAMLQPAVAFLEESFDFARRGAVAVLGLATGAGALLVLHLSHDLVALDVLDFWVGQVGIFLLGTVVCLVFSRGLGVEQGVAEARRGALVALPRWFPFVIRWVSPAYLLVVLAAFLWQDAPGYVARTAGDPEARVALGFLLAVVAAVTALVVAAGRRMDAGGGCPPGDAVPR